MPAAAGVSTLVVEVTIMLLLLLLLLLQPITSTRRSPIRLTIRLLTEPHHIPLLSRISLTLSNGPPSMATHRTLPTRTLMLPRQSLRPTTIQIMHLSCTLHLSILSSRHMVHRSSTETRTNPLRSRPCLTGATKAHLNMGIMQAAEVVEEITATEVVQSILLT